MSPNKIHLICNAHLDPVWLWEWEEGAAEALSTFRQTSQLCQEFKDFVFNHNEAILYKWVEEYEPSLFRKIQRLVKQKKWQVIGGWYLQPDCNMPCGESFVRQILLGKRYFRQKFGIDIRAAANLDPFGHSRGLVQILKKSGFDSYLFCRPSKHECLLPADEFIWVGHDGSEIMATRASAHYNSLGGQAAKKVEEWMKNNPRKKVSILLWGVGNHGGGASRQDLKALARLIRKEKSFSIIHSTPKAYFKELKRHVSRLPRHAKDINPWAVGCYTSMIRVKQKHRALENEIYSAEKMASAAWVQGFFRYPEALIREALYDLALSEFHDILPGSSIQPAEEAALRLIDHGLEISSRIKARAFFALAAGEPKAKPGEFPILVYNPHPYKAKSIIAYELQPYEPNWSGGFLFPKVSRKGKACPCQLEKELSNLNLEWRKRVVFQAELEPSQMNRFDCRLEYLPSRPKPKIKIKGGLLVFKTKDLKISINKETGFIDSYQVNGLDYLEKNAFQPLVMKDSSDPWEMRARNFRRLEGKFVLAAKDEGGRFSGIETGLPDSVRVIEDGPVRTVVEVALCYRNSFIFERYKLPKQGTEIELELRVFWNEKDKMLKLSIPTLIKEGKYLGQVAYGLDELPSNGDEAVSQKWVAIVSQKSDMALTVINDGVYGSDFLNGELRISLLRSPAYSADPVEGRPMLVQDRYVPRHDQGERIFRFWLKAGKANERLKKVDRESLFKNEKPYVLCFSPPGSGKKAKPFAVLSDNAVQITALKKAEQGNCLIIRLFEPEGKKQETFLSLPFIPIKRKIVLSPFEIKTLKFNLKTHQFQEVDLLERPI